MIIEYEVGRLYCSDVRRYLDQAKFMGADIDYMESKGFLSRSFVIKGSESSVAAAKRDIDRWIESAQEDE
jgi:hypothetical protein